jgi:PRTRC genetic system protein B
VIEVEVDRQGASELSLSGAFLVYNNGAFVTWAVCKDGALTGPVPVGEDDVLRFAHQLLPATRQWLEPQHLFVGHGEALWYTPPQLRTLFFETADEALNGLSGQNFPQPGLVWLRQQQSLYVYAITEPERPTPDTKLYRTPYFNISRSHVCLGSGEQVQHFDANSTRLVENAFYNSAFSHVSEAFLHGWSGSHCEFWQHAQMQGGFPVEYLIGLERTVGQEFRL